LANLHQLGDDALLFPIDERGVAQGSPLSPLIGNVLLRDFDRLLNGRGITCIRYIDDFLLLGPSESAVRKAFGNAQRILGDLGLRAYEPGRDQKADKGEIDDGFDFLGCFLAPGLIQPARAARQKIVSQVDAILADGRRAIAKAPRASAGRIPKQRYAQTLVKLDLVVRGWGHAFSFCDGRQCFEEIDRQIDSKVAAFRRRVSEQLHGCSAADMRRILGLHLLADTAMTPLPPVNGPKPAVKALVELPGAGAAWRGGAARDNGLSAPF
jgi:hypothetical protein